MSVAGWPGVPDPRVDEAGHIFHVTMLRNKSSGQILYLEAGKDLVDVLLSFLVLPVGKIIGLLNAEGAKKRKFGAMDNIYKSVEKIQESMLYVDKKLLTKPRLASPAFHGPELLHFLSPDHTNTPSLPPPKKRTYLCEECYESVGTDPNFTCPSCGTGGDRSSPKRRVTVVPSTKSQPALVSKPKDGYVKKNVTYIVSNNLEIMPSSSIKCMDVLIKMKIQSLSNLQSIDQEIGRADVLKILLAAFSGSENPLSDVFDRKVEESTS